MNYSPIKDNAESTFELMNSLVGLWLSGLTDTETFDDEMRTMYELTEDIKD